MVAELRYAADLLEANQRRGHELHVSSLEIMRGTLMRIILQHTVEADIEPEQGTIVVNVEAGLAVSTRDPDPAWDAAIKDALDLDDKRMIEMVLDMGKPSLHELDEPTSDYGARILDEVGKGAHISDVTV